MARTGMITIRVDEAEHALFKGAAAGVGISISEYARDAMLARMALEEAPAPVTKLSDSESWVINSPAEVEEVMERVAERNMESVSPRSFTPDPKVVKPRTKVEPVVVASTCRHGLMRCKVCGTLQPPS